MSRFDVTKNIETPTQAIISLQGCQLKEHKDSGLPYLLFTVNLRQHTESQDAFEGIPEDSNHYFRLAARKNATTDDLSKFMTKLKYLMESLNLPVPMGGLLTAAVTECYESIDKLLEAQDYAPDIVAVVTTSTGDPRVDTDNETGATRVIQGHRFANVLSIKARETHNLS